MHDGYHLALILLQVLHLQPHLCILVEHDPILDHNSLHLTGNLSEQRHFRATVTAAYSSGRLPYIPADHGLAGSPDPFAIQLLVDPNLSIIDGKLFRSRAQV